LALQSHATISVFLVRVAGALSQAVEWSVGLFITITDKIRMIESWRMGWAGHVAYMGEMRNACMVLVKRPEGKRTL
jgi:hypothetical protein